MWENHITNKRSTRKMTSEHDDTHKIQPSNDISGTVGLASTGCESEGENITEEKQPTSALCVETLQAEQTHNSNGNMAAASESNIPLSTNIQTLPKSESGSFNSKLGTDGSHNTEQLTPQDRTTEK